MIPANKVIILLLVLFGTFLFPLSQIDVTAEKQASQIINSFMESKGIQAEPGTEEYKIIMRKIIWGEYPELTSEDSKFIENPDELDFVFDYAWKYSGYKELYGGDDEPDIREANLSGRFLENLASLENSFESSRSNAIAYAYDWSIQGGKARNPDYPDFGNDDCTNFISQAMKAGNFIQKGNGDGCEYEDTNIEWYVDYNPSPPIWCIGETRYWEWSTSWSVPWPFRDYFAYQNAYGVVHGWTTSVSTAKYYLAPGDVVQLQFDDNGNWTTYHTMIVTSEDAYELYATYHSNAGGYDEVDKPLSSIDLGTNKRILLVGINFPAATYLPLILKNGYNIESSGESQNPYPEPELKETQPIEPYPAP